ncbi:MAG TPA: hypothetical protein VLE97_00925, partial [Gaiellaceae bacterium]|nr:hypothetical protein [Gaiellaceae bacterium]
VAVSEVPVQGRLLRRRDRRMPREQLEQLEGSDLDLGGALTWLVREQIGIDEAGLNAARRRAMFVLAAGGDPNREIDLDSLAAERLATELDTPERRAALAAALVGLADDAKGLAVVSEVLAELRAEPELAWRSLALALLADELADD